MTDSERLFNILIIKFRNLFGFSYLKQFPVSINKNKFYILDFYIEDLKLAFELDGGIHKRQEDYDINRDYELLSSGIIVYRFNNEEIGERKFSQKLEKIIRDTYLNLYDKYRIRSKLVSMRIANKILSNINNVTPEKKLKMICTTLDKEFKSMIHAYYCIQSITESLKYYDKLHGLHIECR